MELTRTKNLLQIYKVVIKNAAKMHQVIVWTDAQVSSTVDYQSQYNLKHGSEFILILSDESAHTILISVVLFKLLCIEILFMTHK